MSDLVFAGYFRFSDNKQSETSLEDQEAACRAYIDRLGGSLGYRYSDSAIAGDAIVSRPGLIQLMEDAAAHKFGNVVVFSFDRFSRSMSGAAYLFEQLSFHRIALHTVQDGVVTDMHVALRGYESASFLKKLGADTKRGQAGAVRRGAIAGSPLYGLRVVRSTEMPAGGREKHPEEAVVVVLIFTLYADGVSPKAICRYLNQEGCEPAWKFDPVSGVIGV